MEARHVSGFFQSNVGFVDLESARVVYPKALSRWFTRLPVLPFLPMMRIGVLSMVSISSADSRFLG